MKKTINANDLYNEFKAYNRDYYTYDGYEALLNYYDQDMELDVIAICCDCTEYGDGAACSISDMIADYGYLINGDIDDDIPREDYMELLVDALNDRTTVLELPNGNYIVFAF